MSTKNQTQEKVVAKKEAPANKVAKSTQPVQEQEVDTFKNLMEKIQHLEQLKEYYSKLNIKKEQLQKALIKMTDVSKKNNAPFSDEDKEESPYQIVLKGKGQYNAVEEIFKISKPDTVTNFTNYLLREVGSVLDVLQTEILEYSKKIQA